MKTNIKTLFGSFAIAGAMLMVPTATFATEMSSGVRINQDGNITLKGVEVTSISGNVINAILRFKNTVTALVVNTNASTTVNGSLATSTSFTNIKAGDKLNVSALFTSFGSPFTVTATKINGMTSFMSTREKSGVVQSINTVNNSFIIKTKDGKLVTVQNTASTTFYLGNKVASTFVQVATLNSKVEVKGVLSTDGTILTASKVTLKTSELNKNKDKKEKDNNKDKSKHGNNSNRSSNDKHDDNDDDR